MVNTKSREKIGILGGTFNPIHVGHLLMAEYAREVADLSKVFIMPTGKSYLKDNTNVLDGERRLEMVHLSIEGNPFFIASDMEIQRGGNTYTYETLLQFHRDYPDAELFFIVGADSLFSMDKWVKPDVIFNNCTILAAGRNQSSEESLIAKKQELEKRFGAKICIMDFPQIEISSTAIRDNIRMGRSVRYMVHDKVRAYIENNGIYKS